MANMYDEKEFFVDLGHPLVNRVFEGVVKSAGVGALRAVALDASKLLCQEERVHPTAEATVRQMGKDAAQWGLGAGLYCGFTDAMQEARGKHDWINAAVGGALTGAALSLTEQRNRRHDRVLEAAITGAAIATAADLLLNLTR